MEEHVNLAPIAFLLLSAVIGGLVLAGLRQPPLVGYLVVGALFGPSGLSLITDRDTVGFFAELGVLVLLFVVGMQLSLRDFRSVWRTALGATALQVMVSVALMLALGQALGWPPGRAILFGFVLALSSTAVGIKLLEDVGELRTATGRCAVGVLIAQDLAVVLMLVVVSGLSADGSVDLPGLLLRLLLALLVVALLIWLLGRQQRIRLPFRALLVRHPDLAPVGALAICLLGAALSGALGLSTGLGAFLAGLYLGNTTERVLMLRASQPVHSLLLMMFFLSIGLLIDLPFVMQNLGTVVLLVGFVLLINSGINVLVLRAVGEPLRVAVLAGFALAQIGEFAFLLAEAGKSSALIGAQAERLVVAVIAISMAISPLWLELARRMHALQARPQEELSRLLARLLRDDARRLGLGPGRARRVGEP